MANYASKIVKQAAAWIGLNEADGSYKEILSVYNAHRPLARSYPLQPSDAWCAGFVSAVAIKCGMTNIIPTEVSCNKMIDLFKKMGAFIEDENRTPNPGEILFYDWDDNGIGDNKGSSDHVGIVEKVSGGNITVIEGNYSNAVKRRILKVNARSIRGYGVPKYDPETEAKPTVNAKPVASTTPGENTIERLAREVMAGKHGNGDARKAALGNLYDAVQEKVNELSGAKPAASANPTVSETGAKKITIDLAQLSKGSKCAEVYALQAMLNAFNKAGLVVDGDFGAKTEAAVKQYQKSRGLGVDGIVGSITWTQLLKE